MELGQELEELDIIVKEEMQWEKRNNMKTYYSVSVLTYLSRFAVL